MSQSESSDLELLIVEDDRDLAETYELWLSDRNDFSPIIEQRAQRALSYLPDKVDGLLLDRRLPDLPGPELLSRIDDSGLPVVVVTAYEPDDHLDVHDVDRYLMKPITKPTLLDAIDTVFFGQ